MSKFYLMQKFLGLFNVPGEGFVAELSDGEKSALYDRQGLQYLIVDRKQKGLDAQAAAEALVSMNSLEGSLNHHVHS